MSSWRADIAVMAPVQCSYHQLTRIVDLTKYTEQKLIITESNTSVYKLWCPWIIPLIFITTSRCRQEGGVRSQHFFAYLKDWKSYFLSMKILRHTLEKSWRCLDDSHSLLICMISCVCKLLFQQQNCRNWSQTQWSSLNNLFTCTQSDLYQHAVRNPWIQPRSVNYTSLKILRASCVFRGHNIVQCNSTFCKHREGQPNKGFPSSLEKTFFCWPPQQSN